MVRVQLLCYSLCRQCIYVYMYMSIYSCVHAQSLQSCPTFWDPMDCSPPGSFVHGNSPGKNTGVGCHALLQGIFPRDRICISWGSCFTNRFFTSKPLGSPVYIDVCVCVCVCVCAGNVYAYVCVFLYRYTCCTYVKCTYLKWAWDYSVSYFYDSNKHHEVSYFSTVLVAIMINPLTKLPQELLERWKPLR